MKAVISNKIYLKVPDHDEYDRIKQILTYRIPRFNAGPGVPPLIIKNYGIVNEDKKILAIPSGRVDLIPEDYEIEYKTCKQEADFPEPEGTLWDNQKDIFDRCKGSGLITANPGFGKTFVATHLAAAKFKYKTAIIVHTKALAYQWIRDIKKILGIEAGLIGDGIYRTDSPIVVAIHKSYIKHHLNLQDTFGTMMVDECHRVPAKIFTTIVSNSKAHIKIGLTATPKRKDGKHVLLTDVFSETVLKAKDKGNQMKPTVHRFFPSIKIPGGVGDAWVTRITDLCNDRMYIEYIQTILEQYAKGGYKVLFVADRNQILNDLHERLSSNSILIHSKSPKPGNDQQQQREALLKEVEDGNKSIILGGIKIFNEGISENHLSCLVLGTPINNDPLLEQLCGRITRTNEGKKSPIIVDLVLKGNTGKEQARRRLNFYHQQGWLIKDAG